MEIRDFIEHYPRLYHMAERRTWPSIKAHGLLSTTAMLDRLGIVGSDRQPIEECHRPSKVRVGTASDTVILRDQKAMAPSRLEAALIDGATPTDWYKLLNGRVFMWAEEHRLLGLLGARRYRRVEHDVLTINSEALLKNHSGRIWLCRMNSGNTFPVPHRRGLRDFVRIQDYPTKKRSGAPLQEVVEVVVDYSIPDIATYVTDVRRMKCREVLGVLPL